MLNKEKLVNLVVFMERAAPTLKGSDESRAWAQTYEALHVEIEELNAAAAKAQLSAHVAAELAKSKGDTK